MFSSHKLIVVALVLFLASPALSILVPMANPITNYDTDEQRTARNASAFARMMGEFRTSLGDMLFVKTERYLDSGIGYEPHIDAREMERTGLADESSFDASLANPKMQETAQIKPGQVANDDHATHDDHAGHDHDHDHDHDHSSVETLIRTADSDFRGFIGRLEREVKPWRDPSQPHQHTAGTELLPWYRLATLSDPHNVRNFMIGAWWLKSLDDPRQKEEAVKFLNEGITKNPNAYELYLMRGYVFRQAEKIEAAKKDFAKSAQLALKTRPAEGPVEKKTPKHPWDITDEEQMIAAMTMHTLMVRDSESTQTAARIVNDYRKIFPGEGALLRLQNDIKTFVP